MNLNNVNSIAFLIRSKSHIAFLIRSKFHIAFLIRSKFHITFGSLVLIYSSRQNPSNTRHTHFTQFTAHVTTEQFLHACNASLFHIP